MKTKFALSVLAACALSLLPATMYAHSNSNGQGEEKAENGKVRTVTGCLEQDGNEYEVRTHNGSTWELKAEGLNLADHVGHTVKVTGTVDHAKMHHAKEAAKDTTGNDKPEHGHLTVTNLKMVSNSCSR